MKLTGAALPSLTSATVGNVLPVQLCVLAVAHGVHVKNNSRTQHYVCGRYLAEASRGLLSGGDLRSDSYWPTKHSILNDASQSR